MSFQFSLSISVIPVALLAAAVGAFVWWLAGKAQCPGWLQVFFTLLASFLVLLSGKV